MFLKSILEIVVPDNRIRKEFNAAELQELADDIADKGLLHPIVLRPDGTTLLAGERRLRAMRLLASQSRRIPYRGPDGVSVLLDLGVAPVALSTDLTDYQLREAELTENLCRTDLSWQEQAVATAELHAMRQEENPSQTAQDTALEIAGHQVDGGTAKRMVTDQTIIAENLHRPEVAAAKSSAEALKIIKKDAENILQAELARRQQQAAEQQQGDEYQQHLLHPFDMTQEESWLDLPEPPACIIADPPYGIGADTQFGDQAQLEHEYDDTWENASKCYESIAFYGMDHSAAASHAYVFLDMQHWQKIVDIFQSAGWWVWKTPLTWYKGNTGLLPYPEHGPRRVTEFILYAIKGTRQVTSVHLDLIDAPNVKHKTHAAEKPVDLYLNLLRRSVRPGEMVLDPCCGSGVIFEAAQKLGVRSVGWELGSKSFATAAYRLSGNHDYH